MSKLPKSQLKKIRARIVENEKHLKYLESKKRQYIDIIINDKEISNELKAYWNEYNQSYNSLVFSHGEFKGEKGLYKALKQGDTYAMEYAVCFIESRPYFYRSGYMYKDLLRRLNKAPLSDSQRERYMTIKQQYRELIRKYREQRGW